MPMFYFNVFTNVDAYDHEGVERRDLEAAGTDAMSGARHLAANHVRDGIPIRGRDRIEITDEGGSVLDMVRLVDFVDLRV